MKRTVWRPIVLGLLLGLLAAVGTVTGFSYLAIGLTENAIGFFFSLMLLSAALGGPLAGALTVTIFITISTYWGPSDMKEVLSDPVAFWSNLLVLAALMALIGLAYRFIFERLKLPARLLPWAGIIIAFYVINPPITIGTQFYFHDEAGLLPAVLGAYKDYIPQAIFDIFFTSLVFIALPARYRRPLWYEVQAASPPGVDGKQAKVI